MYYIEVETNIPGVWTDAFPSDPEAEYETYEEAQKQLRCMQEVDFWHDVENIYRIAEV